MLTQNKEKRTQYKYNRIILKTVLTEKSTNDLDKFARYIFVVDKNSNKRVVKDAIFAIFGVRPIKVNIARTPDNRKLARVTLNENDVILLEKP